MTLIPGLLFALCTAPLASVLWESPPPTKQPANLAIAAEVSTSYISGHETLMAVNDGVTPGSSHDTSHGAYSNWPKRGVQWVQYSWTKPVRRIPRYAALDVLRGSGVSFDGVVVFGFSSAGGGTSIFISRSIWQASVLVNLSQSLHCAQRIR
jgi:hypothetical protein